MKKLLLFGAIASVLASCSSVEITKRQHRSGYYVSFGNKTEVKTTEQKNNEVLAVEENRIIEAEELKNEVEVNEISPVNFDQNSKVNTLVNEGTVSKEVNNTTFEHLLIEEKVETKKSSSIVNKISKKVVSGKLKQADDNMMLLILVILALFIPPIAVGLKKNWALTPLLISILLTLFFFLPGVIHALLVVFDVI